MSVVIPARNDAPALQHCLSALALQLVAPLEIIVVDNASADSTAAIAGQFGARVLYQDRIGIPQAAATGYDAARGEVIARLDADSRPPASWVGQVAASMADPRLAAVTGLGRFYDVNGAGRLTAGLYLGAYYLLCYAALGHHSLWGSNMALRRTVWQQVRRRVHDDAEVHDDLDLAFAVGPGGRIHLEPSLQVGASARGARGVGPLRRRFARARRTLWLNWAHLPPWRRWARRLRLRWVRFHARPESGAPER